MTDSERVQEWVGFYKASPAGYQMNALMAVLMNDNEKTLAQVLRQLGLESSLELVKDAVAKR